MLNGVEDHNLHFDFHYHLVLIPVQKYNKKIHHLYSSFADEKDDLELGDNKAVDSLKIDSMVELEYLDNDNVAYKKDVDNMVDSGLDSFKRLTNTKVIKIS